MSEPSPVEQVRAGIDVVDLISQHVTLKKAGRSFKGLCPFHAEKTPSMYVFPETGRWHCFGCGEGGDVFTFLMKIENLTFPDALSRLADRIGVVVTRTREAPERKEANQKLYVANEAAAVYFHALLLNSRATMDYVLKRGISDETLRAFLLGFAPNGSDAMQKHLVSQGFTLDELLAAGLLYEPENGPLRDRYRGRLMFPIRDSDGRIVSFGARGLTPDTNPKYLNGPKTDIFDKSSTLYGLFDGLQMMRKERRAIVVEGYVDVVIAHQAGFRNVVATLGTSITELHLRTLARQAGEICLALDPDNAGQAAALRGAEVAREALPDTAVPIPTWRGLVRYEASHRAKLLVATLPDGKDPDELILESPDRWREAIAAARPVVEFALDWILGRYDLQTTDGKSEAAAALAPLLLEVADPVKRSDYVERAAERLHVDAGAIRELLHQRDAALHQRQNRPVNVRGMSATPRTPVPLPGRARAFSEQDYAIGLLAASAERGLALPALDPEDFTDPAARTLLEQALTLLTTDARDDWRPAVLELVDEPWLAATTGRVRASQESIRELTDAQIVAEGTRIRNQLRMSRLSVEIGELALLLADTEVGETARIATLIADKNRQRATLEREVGHTPGAGKVHGRAAIVPARFRFLPS